MSSRSTKRARAEEAADPTKEEDPDVRLGEGLRALLGGRKYVSKKDLTRSTMLTYLESIGEIVDVKFVHVSVEMLGSDAFDITMEKGGNTSSVRHLKRAIQEQHGIAFFAQQIFLSDKKASKEELNNEDLLENSMVVLRVEEEEGM